MLAESQDALSEALNKAEAANRAKTVFLNNMSHDMRTPMNAIVGFTALAVERLENTALVKDYLSKIALSSQHLLSLINDVLDMSRIESGKVTIEET
ncbi:MAG: hybrid sensor histidine kinase/response regulator, partial [Desulfovibrio sp.]|nr:hybrid sensor histidine kinase/response regulator [Desulfovibrio sp.]